LFEYEFCQVSGWEEEGQLCGPTLSLLSHAFDFAFFGVMLQTVCTVME